MAVPLLCDMLRPKPTPEVFENNSSLLDRAVALAPMPERNEMELASLPVEGRTHK